MIVRVRSSLLEVEMKKARGCWVRGRGAGTAPKARMAASLLHYTAPQTCGSAGLAGHGESAPAAWLGSEAESSQGHKRQGCEERETATKMRGREERRAGVLLPARAADKAGGCQGGSGRRAHPGTRGTWEAGGARRLAGLFEYQALPHSGRR